MPAHASVPLKSASLLVAALLLPLSSAARSPDNPWLPDKGFVQLGVAEDATAATLGVVWTSDWSYPFAGGQFGLYWEVSMGRWVAELEDGTSSSAWVTQLGITPVLRWMPDRGAWFVELGIGANLLLPIYRSEDKTFSTTFNFGDHLAVGAVFGDRRQHELALRIQHFSNAGIKHPNPGEDFVQLRYVYGF